ncbi:MAG: hypothetical protein KDA31_12735 [Phycisphaerales bacterium]|nr:hypothetical protein [Phycisphaerales bacterium]MCB9836682.1 hypothetical protein [Phycisphaera sp.]
MAEKPKKQEEAPAEVVEETKGGSKKVLLIVVAIMVIETLGVGAFLMLSGKAPSAAEATVVGDSPDSPEALVEVQVVADRFQNMHTGRVWQWDTEVFIQVRRKDQERVSAELERRKAEITAGVGELIRKATHTQLREPELQTLNRKLEAYFVEVFGTDADNRPRAVNVLIPKMRGAPADF